MNELASNFARSIMKITETSELENPVISSALNPIVENCLTFVDQYRIESAKIENLNKFFESIPKNKMVL